MNHSLHLIMQLFFRPLQFPEKQDQKALFFYYTQDSYQTVPIIETNHINKNLEKALKRKIA